MLENIRELHNF